MKCNAKNHFAVVCRAKPSQTYKQSCKVLDDESDTDDVFAVENAGTRKRKLHANLQIGRSQVRFQLDSGATVNIMSSRPSEKCPRIQAVEIN